MEEQKRRFRNWPEDRMSTDPSRWIDPLIRLEKRRQAKLCETSLYLGFNWGRNWNCIEYHCRLVGAGLGILVNFIMISVGSFTEKYGNSIE